MGERDLESLGITPREYSVLEVLIQQAPLTQTQIGAILGLDRTTMLKLGASLERKGLVVRQRDADDRRAYAVALTPAGGQVRAQGLARLVSCEGRFLTELSGEERHQFHDLLSRVTEL